LSRSVTYLDSSALVKLVLRERETGALRRFIHGRSPLTSSAVARVEVIRAARQRGPIELRRARLVLARINALRVEDDLIEAVAYLEPLSLRTLDAMHLASAMAIGDELGVVVTYDVRMRTAAAELGLPLAAPGT